MNFMGPNDSSLMMVDYNPHMPSLEIEQFVTEKLAQKKQKESILSSIHFSGAVLALGRVYFNIPNMFWVCSSLRPTQLSLGVGMRQPWGWPTGTY